MVRMASDMFMQHRFAHVMFDQPPDMIDIADELGRAFDVKRAWPWQIDLHDFLDTARPAREDEYSVG
jgi:hypothetical protein